MNAIFKSASKIAMLLVLIVSSIAFWAVVLSNITAEPVVNWVIALFSGIVSSITTYYFVKNKTSDQTTPQ